MADDGCAQVDDDSCVPPLQGLQGPSSASFSHPCIYVEAGDRKYPVCLTESYIIILVALAIGGFISGMFGAYTRCAKRHKRRAALKSARLRHERDDVRGASADPEVRGSRALSVLPEWQHILEDAAEVAEAEAETPKLWFLDLVSDRVYSRRLSVILIVLAFGLASEIALGSTVYRWPFLQATDVTPYDIRFAASNYIAMLPTTVSESGEDVVPITPVPTGMVFSAGQHGVGNCRVRLKVEPNPAVPGMSPYVVSSDDDPLSTHEGLFNLSTAAFPAEFADRSGRNRFRLTATANCFPFGSDALSGYYASDDIAVGTLWVVRGTQPEQRLPELPGLEVVVSPHAVGGVTIGQNFAAAVRSIPTQGNPQQASQQDSPWAFQAVDVSIHRVGTFESPALDVALVGFLSGHRPQWDALAAFSQKVLHQFLGVPGLGSLSSLLTSRGASGAIASLEALLLPRVFELMKAGLLSCLVSEAGFNGVSIYSLAVEIIANATWAESVVHDCVANVTSTEGVEDASSKVLHTLSQAAGGTGSTLLNALSSFVRLGTGSPLANSAHMLWQVVTGLAAALEAELGITIDSPLGPKLQVNTTRAYVNAATGAANFTLRMVRGEPGLYFLRFVYRGDAWLRSESPCATAYAAGLLQDFNNSDADACFAVTTSLPFMVHSAVSKVSSQNRLIGDSESVTYDAGYDEYVSSCGGTQTAFFPGANFDESIPTKPQQFLPCLTIGTGIYPSMVWSCPDEDSSHPNIRQECTHLLQLSHCYAYEITSERGAESFLPDNAPLLWTPAISATSPEGDAVQCSDIEVRTRPYAGYFSGGPAEPAFTTSWYPQGERSGLWCPEPHVDEARLGPSIRNLSLPAQMRLVDASPGVYEMRLYCDGIPVGRNFTFQVFNSYVPELGSLTFILGRGDSSFWGTILVSLICIIPLLLANTINPRSPPAVTNVVCGLLAATALIVGTSLVAFTTTDFGQELRTGFINFITIISGVDVGHALGQASLAVAGDITVAPFTTALIFVNSFIFLGVALAFLNRLLTLVAGHLLLAFVIPMGLYLLLPIASVGGMHGARHAVVWPCLTWLCFSAMQQNEKRRGVLLCGFAATIHIVIVSGTFFTHNSPYLEQLITLLWPLFTATIVHCTKARTLPFIAVHAAYLLASTYSFSNETWEHVHNGYDYNDDRTETDDLVISGPNGDCWKQMEDYDSFGTDDITSVGQTYVNGTTVPACRLVPSMPYAVTAATAEVLLVFAISYKLWRESPTGGCRAGAEDTERPATTRQPHGAVSVKDEQSCPQLGATRHLPGTVYVPSGFVMPAPRAALRHPRQYAYVWSFSILSLTLLAAGTEPKLMAAVVFAPVLVLLAQVCVARQQQLQFAEVYAREIAAKLRKLFLQVKMFALYIWSRSLLTRIFYICFLLAFWQFVDGRRPAFTTKVVAILITSIVAGSKTLTAMIESNRRQKAEQESFAYNPRERSPFVRLRRSCAALATAVVQRCYQRIRSKKALPEWGKRRDFAVKHRNAYVYRPDSFGRKMALYYSHVHRLLRDTGDARTQGDANDRAAARSASAPDVRDPSGDTFEAAASRPLLEPLDVEAVATPASAATSRSGLHRSFQSSCRAVCSRLRVPNACKRAPEVKHPHSRFEGRESFKYPQRMLIGGAVTVAILTLFMLGLIVTVEWGSWWLNRGMRIEAGAVKQLELFGEANDGFRGWKGLLLRAVSLALLQVRDAGLHPEVYVDITFYSVTGAAVGAWIGVLLIWRAMLRNYRANIMRLRRGDYFFERSEYNVTSASKFIGYQAIHFTAAFLCIFVVFLCFAIFVVLIIYVAPLQSWLLFDVAIPNAAWIVPWLVFYEILNAIYSGIFTNSSTQTVFTLRFLRSWTYLDYFSIFVYLIAGLMVVLIRVAWLPAITLVSLWRLDKSILSRKWESFDPGYSAYIATLLMDHYYQNPVVNVFVDLMATEMTQARARRLEAIASRDVDALSRASARSRGAASSLVYEASAGAALGDTDMSKLPAAAGEEKGVPPVKEAAHSDATPVRVRLAASGVVLAVTPSQAAVMSACGEARRLDDGDGEGKADAAAPSIGAAGRHAADAEGPRVSTRARVLAARWWTWVTLYRNPSIRQWRKQSRRAHAPVASRP